MKVEIKTMLVKSDYKSFNAEEIENGNRLSKILAEYSKTIKKIEEKYQIDNIIINEVDDSTKEIAIAAYYHNADTFKEKTEIEKVEITVGSDDEIDSFIKALDVAANYLKDNKEKYYYVDNITVVSDFKLDGDYVRLNLYLHNKG